MKTFTLAASRTHWRLLLKIIICTLWLLCIVSAAFSRDKRLPVLGQQPVPQTVCSGSNPIFTIGTVTGTTGAVTLRWQVSVNGGGTYTDISDGAVYSGTATSILTVLNVSTGLNGNLYRCVVTDGSGPITSNGAALTVNITPAASTVTRTTTVCEGATGAGLQAANDPSLTYQWQVSSNNGVTWQNATAADGYTGATTYDLTYPAASLALNGNLYRYRATVTATGCSATSIALDTLRVLSKPVFAGGGSNLTPSALATICPGGNASFTASATGAAAMAYQWQFKPGTSTTYTDLADDAVFTGSQSNSLQITGFTQPAATNLYNVRLIASYPSTLGCASVTNLGTIQVRILSISVQPTDTTVCANSTAGFKVTATGTATVSYQWQTDNGTNSVSWSNIGGAASGAGANTLNLGAVTTAMNGYRYRVAITSGTCIPPTISAERVLTVRRSGTGVVAYLMLP
jgi:hypothetical protein